MHAHCNYGTRQSFLRLVSARFVHAPWTRCERSGIECRVKYPSKFLSDSSAFCWIAARFRKLSSTEESLGAFSPASFLKNDMRSCTWIVCLRIIIALQLGDTDWRRTKHPATSMTRYTCFFVLTFTRIRPFSHFEVSNNVWSWLPWSVFKVYIQQCFQIIMWALSQCIGWAMFKRLLFSVNWLLHGYSQPSLNKNIEITSSTAPTKQQAARIRALFEDFDRLRWTVCGWPHKLASTIRHLGSHNITISYQFTKEFSHWCFTMRREMCLRAV